MPEKLTIQRVPRGLSDLLSCFGGQTPQELHPQVSGVLELVQFYGNTQQQRQTADNAALAEGGVIPLVVPDRQFWVLFQMSARVDKTATMTALRVNLSINDVPVHSEELGPFGATETGQVNAAWSAEYPRILIPGTTLRMGLEVLGTDATAVCQLNCLVGILG